MSCSTRVGDGEPVMWEEGTERPWSGLSTSMGTCASKGLGMPQGGK